MRTIPSLSPCFTELRRYCFYGGKLDGAGHHACRCSCRGCGDGGPLASIVDGPKRRAAGMRGCCCCDFAVGERCDSGTSDIRRSRFTPARKA